MVPGSKPTRIIHKCQSITSLEQAKTINNATLRIEYNKYNIIIKYDYKHDKHIYIFL